MDLIAELYEHTQGRSRPEDVAECVLRALGPSLDRATRALLEQAAKGSLARSAFAYSSMATQFFRATVHVEPQVALTRALMAAPPIEATLPALDTDDCRDPARVRAFVEAASRRLLRSYGDRTKLDKRARFAAGLMKGHRWYNKRLRLLYRLEHKIARMLRGERRFELVRVSKSSLATKLPRAVLERDLASACLVAYLTARMSLRSVFTNGSQERAYDRIAAALLAHAERGAPCWFAIAHAMPDRDVVRHLTEEERGSLLATSFQVMHDAAELLREVWDASRIDRGSMVVARGNDSSTWNEVAGAWNKARESWISMLHALGMESLLDVMLPGKVMRLMAADVAAWHRLSGGGVHPDTAVFAELPLPWQVLDGSERCTRAQIEATCRAHGVSPEAWVGPRSRGEPVPFRATPELVHGVAVTSPALAKTLRSLGVFSGRPHGPYTTTPSDFVVVRDANGFALLATTVAGERSS